MLPSALPQALPPALLSLLLVSTSAAAPHNPQERRDPTSSPQQGLPASYRPDRNPARFPYDILGVVGGYVFTVLLLAVLVLTVGRNMRRRALNPPKTLELELQEKPTLALQTSVPTSPPLSSRSWLKKFKKGSTDQSPISPAVQSPSSFDQRVVDAHKSTAQADMERLYAAVMDHDAKKGYAKVNVDEMERGSDEERRQSSADDSPVSPVKAIYPPDHLGAFKPVPGQPLPSSPRSILSKRSQGSLTSGDSKSARFNLKNLRIAGANQKYPGAASDDEARTPLSPRFQPSLPSPPTQLDSPTGPYDQSEEIDQVQPLPRPAPHRLGSATSSTATLPLRSFNEPLKSPGIQTTVLDRRMQNLSMTTPKTGVPFTPYSPYMPFTPITPVTPHLVSKKDRKMMQKSGGRKRGAANLDEMVQSPKEIFGDVY